MHTDVVWTTIHKTESRDLEVIEAECISTEYSQELIGALTQKIEDTLCLGQ